MRFLPDKERAVEKTVNIGKKGLTSAAHWQIKRPVLARRQIALAQNPCRFRGHSSAGRAPALQAGGRRFDPVWLHQIFSMISGRRASLTCYAGAPNLLFSIAPSKFRPSAVNRYTNRAVIISVNDRPLTRFSII